MPASRVRKGEYGECLKMISHILSHSQVCQFSFRSALVKSLDQTKILSAVLVDGISLKNS